MSKKKDDKVGYKNPPKNRRFQKGKSGNPSGRPKGGRNVGVLMREGLNKTITITENGKTRKMTMREAIVHRTLVDAAKGNGKAREQVFLHAKEIIKSPEGLSAEERFAEFFNRYNDEEELEDIIRGLRAYGQELREKGP